MFELAEQRRLPVVFFTEGGGGRPGDTDGLGVAGLDCMAFHYFGAALRARAAGRHQLRALLRRQRRAARLLRRRHRDAQNSNIGMGGPAMIEGGGLGVFRPEEVGPIDVQVPNGVVDVAGRRRGRGGRASRSSTSPTSRARCRDWRCADQRVLRAVIPENRLRVYDVRRGDRDARRHRLGARAAPRLRPRHGHGARAHRGPAARRHRQQPDAPRRRDRHATAPTRPRASCSSATRSTSRSCSSATRPGIMVGPEVEKTALVRHARAHVRDRREPHRAVLHDRAAQGLRPRRAGDGGRQLQGAALHASRGRPASSAAWASRVR